jgi:hypothetical protein
MSDIWPMLVISPTLHPPNYAKIAMTLAEEAVFQTNRPGLPKEDIQNQ